MVRAGRKARDEQKHTLGSCCSQQQVQGRGGGGRGVMEEEEGGVRTVLWKGEKEHVSGGVRRGQHMGSIQ